MANENKVETSATTVHAYATAGVQSYSDVTGPSLQDVDSACVLQRVESVECVHNHTAHVDQASVECSSVAQYSGLGDEGEGEEGVRGYVGERDSEGLRAYVGESESEKAPSGYAAVYAQSGVSVSDDEIHTLHESTGEGAPQLDFLRESGFLQFSPHDSDAYVCVLICVCL
jgi:hypothetical protein